MIYVTISDHLLAVGDAPTQVICAATSAEDNPAQLRQAAERAIAAWFAPNFGICDGVHHENCV